MTALLTACGASKAEPAASPSTNAQKLLAYSGCVRSHGVPDYPDPDSSGGFSAKPTAQQLGVSDSQLQAAQSACTSLVPDGGNGPAQATLRQSWSDMRSFAVCMRSHGVPNCPDPTPYYPQHPDQPYFNLQPAGIDQNAPQIVARIDERQPLLHGNNPQHLGAGAS